MNPQDWRYKAEGNKHIVFCDDKGKVLRLKKFNAFCECNGIVCQKCKGSKSSELQELLYHRKVVMPLMSNCLSCKCPSRIDVTKDFILKLNEYVQVHRPAYRKHKSLLLSKYGILMEDKTLIHATNKVERILGSIKSDVFCVEVKLKKGFMSDGDPGSNVNLCQFCSQQLFRTFNDGKGTKLNNFCPIDLFSGNKPAMINALTALIECPQNVFRIFKNGRLSFSQEILDQKVKEKKFQSGLGLLTEVLKSFYTNKSAYTNGKSKTFLSFFDLLCSALLLPLDNENQKNLSTASQHKCYGQKYKKLFIKDPALVDQSFKLPKSCQFCLPSSCILGRVLSCQLISNFSYSLLRSYYCSIIKNKNFKVAEELDGSFHEKSWENIGSIDVLQNFYSFKNSKANKEKSTDKSGSKEMLQKFLVSKSFCDCSVMVTMKDVTENYVQLKEVIEASELNQSCKSQLLLKSLQNRWFIVQISVVDIDPKPSTRIPLYCKQNDDIKSWITKQTNKLKELQTN